MGFEINSINQLADGTEFVSWEKPLTFTKTYYVDNKNENADDDGPGTLERPFKTIGKAASKLQPGERVVIREGVYYECVRPRYGGTSPEKMISYEAAEGEKVVIKGSAILDSSKWEESKGWSLRFFRQKPDGDPKVWMQKLDPSLFNGYNPFAVATAIYDISCLYFDERTMNPILSYRRGMVYVDGKRLKQVRTYRELGLNKGAFWVEEDGLCLHIRLEDDGNPADHVVEITTKEQVFVPEKPYLGYIRVKGLTLEFAGNGNPVPQKGLLSTYRGHHWIIEDNIIRHANSVGIDAGNECWNACPPPPDFSHHIIRRNVISDCGVCGIAAIKSENMLIEDNLIENIGWQRVYYSWESAGVKVHEAKNMMFRRNVVRKMEMCDGLWLDCSNSNCRITCNVFVDMPDTLRGAIIFEGTRFHNLVDNNIICDVGALLYTHKDLRENNWQTMDKRGEEGNGIYSLGSDDVTIVNNLIMQTTQAGFHSYTIPLRMIDGRGSTERDFRILNNIFYKCRQSAIDFDNVHNYADGNLYIQVPWGFIKILNPDPVMALDLPSVRRYFNWEINGNYSDADIELDTEELTISVNFKKDVVKVPCYKHVNMDFFGNKHDGECYPGPFADLLNMKGKISIDPRKKA